eukprot:10226061-Karenia_brevis.AAC.1
MQQGSASVPLCLGHPLFMAPTDAADIINKCPQSGGIGTLVPPGQGFRDFCVISPVAHSMQQHLCKCGALCAPCNYAICRCSYTRVEL